MLGLKDLERYLRDSYVTNADMVGELLAVLIHRRPNPNRKESISLITDAINRLSLLKTKGLWEKVSEYQLSSQDQDEFFREEAKHITSTQMRHQEEDCSLEAYLQLETMRDNLNLRKRLLVKFLKLRQTMYSDREASSRVLAALYQPAPKGVDALDTLESVIEEILDIKDGKETAQDNIMRTGEKTGKHLCVTDNTTLTAFSFAENSGVFL